MARKITRVQLKVRKHNEMVPRLTETIGPFFVAGQTYDGIVKGDCADKGRTESFVSETLRNIEPLLKNRHYFLNGLTISYYEPVKSIRT